MDRNKPPLKIKTLEEIRAEIRPETLFYDTTPSELKKEQFQATLYVTDDQMGLLNNMVANELKRVRRELTKVQTSKQLRKLEDLECDLKAIQESLKENVW